MAPDTSETRRVTFNQLPKDVSAGFEPSTTVRIEVIGARTTGQFVLTPGGVADAVGIAAALRESAQSNATEFASVTTVTTTNVAPTATQIFSSTISSDVEKVFAQSGLENPRSVSDISHGAKSWLKVRGEVSGYVPGTVVYMIVTTQPTILQSVLVGRNGIATISGFVPLDGLPSGPHNIRIVGTRQFDGVTAASNGTIKLSPDAIHEIGRFDPGTQATVIVQSPDMLGGQFTSIREVLLAKNIAWWTIWLALLVSLVGLIVVALRRPASSRATYLVAFLSFASVLPASVIGWKTSTYVLWWSIPIVLATWALLLANGLQRKRSQ